MAFKPFNLNDLSIEKFLLRRTLSAAQDFLWNLHRKPVKQDFTVRRNSGHALHNALFYRDLFCGRKLTVSNDLPCEAKCCPYVNHKTHCRISHELRAWYTKISGAELLCSCISFQGLHIVMRQPTSVLMQMLEFMKANKKLSTPSSPSFLQRHLITLSSCSFSRISTCGKIFIIQQTLTIWKDIRPLHINRPPTAPTWTVSSLLPCAMSVSSCCRRAARVPFAAPLPA